MFFDHLANAVLLVVSALILLRWHFFAAVAHHHPKLVRHADEVVRAWYARRDLSGSWTAPSVREAEKEMHCAVVGLQGAVRNGVLVPAVNPFLRSLLDWSAFAIFAFVGSLAVAGGLGVLFDLITYVAEWWLAQEGV